MSYRDAVSGLGEDVGNLQHASRATRGHRLTPRLQYVVTLSPAYGCGDLIVLQVETPTATTTPVGFSHLLEAAPGIGLEQGSRLRRHAQGFLEMAWVMVGHQHCLPKGALTHPCYAKLVHEKL
jgi:hypothetical protein